MILISGLNTNGVDWQNNLNTFIVANDNAHSLYNDVAVLAKSSNMDYVSFNFILTTISTLMIAFVVFKLSTRPNMVLSLILIFPFIDNIIQKRGYYTIGIAIFGIYWATRVNSKVVRTVIYFLTAVMAYQFHASAILFFTIPLFFLLPERFQNVFTGIIVLGGTIFEGHISSIVSSLAGGALAEKSELYFTQLASNSISHYLFWIFWQVVQVGIIYYIYRLKGENDETRFVWRLNVWSMCLIPLYMFDPVFTRIYRIVLYYNYITITNNLMFDKAKLSKIGFWALIIQIIMSLVSFYVFDINSNLGIDGMVFELFRSNRFLMQF